MSKFIMPKLIMPKLIISKLINLKFYTKERVAMSEINYLKYILILSKNYEIYFVEKSASWYSTVKNPSVGFPSNPLPSQVFSTYLPIYVHNYKEHCKCVHQVLQVAASRPEYNISMHFFC